MLPRMSMYVKSYDDQIKWMYFLIEDDDLLEKYNTFLIKSALILKKNLIANLSTIRIFRKQK